ncbi:MAG: hypothetical protein Q9180_000232 [Flavoplaca navasiana]
MPRYGRCSSGTFDSSSSWTGEFTLNNSTAWTSCYTQALIALEILMVLALVGSLLLVLKTRSKTPWTKKIFLFFVAAILLMIFTSTFQCIDRILPILNEGCVRGQKFYFIFEIIVNALQYLADAILLAVIFVYMIPSSVSAKLSTQSSRFQGPTLIHLLICAPLGLIWLVTTIFQLVIIVRSANPGTASGSIARAIRTLDLVYNGIYFVAAVEIFALGAIILTSCSKTINDIPPGYTKKSLLLFPILISLPLFIRSFWQVTISARWNLNLRFSSNGFMSPEVRFAQILFYYLCTTLIYIGLALIIKSFGSEPTFTSVHDAEEDQAGSGSGNPNCETEAGYIVNE